MSIKKIKSFNILYMILSAFCGCIVSDDDGHKEAFYAFEPVSFFWVYICDIGANAILIVRNDF